MKSPKTYLKDSFSEIWFQEMVLAALCGRPGGGNAWFVGCGD
jgi:hypothetical protein